MEESKLELRAMDVKAGEDGRVTARPIAKRNNELVIQPATTVDENMPTAEIAVGDLNESNLENFGLDSNEIADLLNRHKTRQTQHSMEQRGEGRTKSEGPTIGE